MKIFFAAALIVTIEFAATAEELAPQLKLSAEHLNALREFRQKMAAQRWTKDIPDHGVYNDYRAMFLTGTADKKISSEQAIKLARKANAQILFAADKNEIPKGMHGLKANVLIFGGSAGDDGIVRFPKFHSNGTKLWGGELRFLSSFNNDKAAGYNGAISFCCQPETLNQTDAKLGAEFRDEVISSACGFNRKDFDAWLALNREKPFICFPGVQAGDTDTCECACRSISTHVFARDLNDDDIRAALREGRTYIAYDWLCDPTGFMFGAINNFGVFTMGDPAPLFSGSTRVMAFTPVPAKLKVFHDDKLVEDANGVTITHNATKPGAYRFEAWLNVSGEERLWIVTPPVYLNSASVSALADFKMPVAEISPKVEVKRDITYVDGKPEDEPKHKLDVFMPKSIEGAAAARQNKDKKLPVLFFVHGGAWRFGDRNMYFPVGNRFAPEGIITVLPSYRLAPANPHPAQIDDTAAAFAWTVKHIAEFGGDPERIYIGGHSAGGHLVSLLTLDEQYLKPFGLTPENIRGTITLSGVYDLVSIGDSQSGVFGIDKDTRLDASPLFHIAKKRAPAFLISYCQWDYPTLPSQGKTFEAALKAAGVSTQIIFVPRENHISEMLSLMSESDPAAEAILRFIK